MTLSADQGPGSAADLIKGYHGLCITAIASRRERLDQMHTHVDSVRSTAEMVQNGARSCEGNCSTPDAQREQSALALTV